MSIQFETTEDGFLKNLSDWNPQVAEVLAARQDISLTPEHWDIILILREFYLEYNTAPSMRTLIKLINHKLGADKGNSIYLHKLFPISPALQANNIAGLPKPIRCI